MMEADDEAGGPMTDWWARFERDAAFRQATIDAYDGRHDVADAVWWVEHPESVAPSGAPAALAPLADLQRAAFARPNDADPGGTVSNLRELEAFRGMVEADRSETLAALEEAQAVLDARPAQRRRVGLLVGGLAAAVCVAGALAFGAVAVFAPGGSAGAFPLFGAVGAGGASGSADGGGVDAAGSGVDAGRNGAGSGGGSIGDGGSSYGATLGDPAASGTGTDGGAGGGTDGNVGGGGAPEPALTAAPYPNFPPDTGAASYADIFAEEQGAADRPPEPLPDGLVGETFRLLSGGQNTAGAVYVAVSTERMICLVVYGSPLEYTYSCDTATGVGAHGLQSSISTRDRTDPATGALNPAIALSARWHPDGTFTLDRSTPYARG